MFGGEEGSFACNSHRTVETHKMKRMRRVARMLNTMIKCKAPVIISEFITPKFTDWEVVNQELIDRRGHRLEFVGGRVYTMHAVEACIAWN